jgi:hypothetical protein
MFLGTNECHPRIREKHFRLAEMREHLSGLVNLAAFGGLGEQRAGRYVVALETRVVLYARKLGKCSF